VGPSRCRLRSVPSRQSTGRSPRDLPPLRIGPELVLERIPLEKLIIYRRLYTLAQRSPDQTAPT
jgi:hypothetical protein